MYKLINLSDTEKRLVDCNTKKVTRECYNYRIKRYLVRDYRKSKIGLGPQKK